MLAGLPTIQSSCHACALSLSRSLGLCVTWLFGWDSSRDRWRQWRRNSQLRAVFLFSSFLLLVLLSSSFAPPSLFRSFTSLHLFPLPLLLSSSFFLRTHVHLFCHQCPDSIDPLHANNPCSIKHIFNRLLYPVQVSNGRIRRKAHIPDQGAEATTDLPGRHTEAATNRGVRLGNGHLGLANRPCHGVLHPPQAAGLSDGGLHTRVNSCRRSYSGVITTKFNL